MNGNGEHTRCSTAAAADDELPNSQTNEDESCRLCTWWRAGRGATLHVMVLFFYIYRLD